MFKKTQYLIKEKLLEHQTTSYATAALNKIADLEKRVAEERSAAVKSLEDKALTTYARMKELDEAARLQEEAAAAQLKKVQERFEAIVASVLLLITQIQQHAEKALEKLKVKHETDKQLQDQHRLKLEAAAEDLRATQSILRGTMK